MFDEDEIIDINNASQEEWELLPGIGKNKAQTIMEHRETIGGKFGSVDDLKNVPGISSVLFESLLPRLICRVPSLRKSEAAATVATKMSLRSSPNTPHLASKRQLKRKSLTKLSKTVLPSFEKRPRAVISGTNLKSKCQQSESNEYLNYPLPSCALPSESVRRRLPSKAAGPPAALANWLNEFHNWNNEERTSAINSLVELCDMSLVRHLMAKIEPLFQRDFISLLPKELALYVLSFLEPKDLCRAAQTCRYWRILAEDNL